jgi:hypothetical protein
MGSDRVIAARLHALENAVKNKRTPPMSSEEYERMGREYRTLKYVVVPFIRTELDPPI